MSSLYLPMNVVFDLDKTLADDSHREHLLEGVHSLPPEDQGPLWDLYFDACEGDTPIWPACRILRVMHLHGYHIEIWTGRPERIREKTMAWLKEYELNFYLHRVRMRPDGVFTPDNKLKEDWLREEQAKGKDGHVPDLVFDDRDRVVKMWRDNGILTCQVAEGDY